MAEKETIKWAVGDIARLKKPHPCGSLDWEITRVGLDFRLRCLGCGHYVLLDRQDFLKRVKTKVEK
jgi:hypothetical protein